MGWLPLGAAVAYGCAAGAGTAQVGDEAQMAAALMVNPLASAVYADSDVFQLYKTGTIKSGQGCRPVSKRARRQEGAGVANRGGGWGWIGK